MNYPSFKKESLDSLDEDIPQKTKYLRVNRLKLVAKESSNTIIHQSNLRNQLLKKKVFDKSDFFIVPYEVSPHKYKIVNTVLLKNVQGLNRVRTYLSRTFH